MKELATNPYDGVNWQNQYKGNFHTHCNRWGTNHSELNPNEVIDLYHDTGYKVLALTEHLTYVWDWMAKADRNPEELGMIAVKGIELHYGSSHDILCLYGDDVPEPAGNDVQKSLNDMETAGAVGIFAHPRAPQYDHYDLSWYVDNYTNFPHMIGLEVYNPRYPVAEVWWDSILSELMPHRPVWGFANDDLHYVQNSFDENKTMILPGELSNSNVRNAIETGKIYFTDNNPREVLINEIVVDESRGTISVDSPNAASIEWVTNGGGVIHQGEIFRYKRNRLLGSYVRVRVAGNTNKAFSQPFGFIGEVERERRFPEKKPTMVPLVRN